MKISSEREIAKNMILSVLAQAVSVLVGFVLNLIVPKFISETNYSLWQSYLLYSQYLGILHFGLLDGIVLRYSQYDYSELDKTIVRSQYREIMRADIIVSAVFLIVSCVFFQGNKRTIGAFLACTICIEITYNYISFIFQITNRITNYVSYITIYRLVYCVLVIGVLVAGRSSYQWFCLAYLVSDAAVILLFGLRYSRELLVGTVLPLTKLLPELKNTLSAGVWLMLSTYAANFLVGSGKMVIQWRWGMLAFGKVSLAFSLTSFFLQFVTAISVVLFPSIKRMELSKLPEMYCKIRQGISPLLFSALLLYYPGSALLQRWLPKYTSSLQYLGILMPSIVYTSKVSLLTNNFLKAYQKEKIMLCINVICVAFGLVLFVLGAWVINSLPIILLFVVAVMILRSVISEIAVMHIINIDIRKELGVEIVLTGVFIACVSLLPRWWGAVLYIFALTGYLYFQIPKNA